MKLLSLLRSVTLLAVLNLIAGIAGAHTALMESFPADGSTLETPPVDISLIFNGQVRLVKMELLVSGVGVATGFQPPADENDSFTVATPNLGAGSYTVNWAAISEDGHTVDNSFSFVVSTETEPVASVP